MSMVKSLERPALLIALASLLLMAGNEFYQVAWGTGTAWGQFSLKWGLGYGFFILLCVAYMLLVGLALFIPGKLVFFARLFKAMEGLGLFRWLLVAVLIILPVWFFQYSSWGVVFDGIYIRLLMWMWIVLLISLLIGQTGMRASLLSNVLLAALLTGCAFAVAAAFVNVTDYPFSLGWSEGNRLWDYSLFFGRARYIYPADRPLAPFLDIGRELLGGVPFIFPNLTILAERLWLAVMAVFPYLVFGLLAFRSPGTGFKTGLLAGLWGFLFVAQGPIHPPLLLCAILVALAWRRPLWLAVPLIAMAAFFAETSRFTWVFAPAMWAGMLELGGSTADPNKKDWYRAVAVGLAGLFGGLAGPRLVNALIGRNAGGLTLALVSNAVTGQPLLWYRLLPNATYSAGILLGLLIAVGPLLAVLIYLAVTGRWVTSFWQRPAILACLLAFLGVGLVVSAKIGGGGDLHNMDMFLIGMLFVAALAWRAGGAEWLRSAENFPGWMRGLMLLLVVLPAIPSLAGLRPISFARDLSWLVTLTDTAENSKASRVLDTLPSDQKVQSSLEVVRGQVENAQTHGPVLFMDQRQLLTFGFVRNVPLVAEYEKKVMMNMALGANQAYFQPFYDDLAAHRFALIVSDPLLAPVKDSDYQFGEENNAWVKWVVKPVLCYYEPVKTISEVRVELLVPAHDQRDCSQELP
jgi:hypothetical protein